MYIAQECGVPPLLAVVTLRDPRVHVGDPNGSNRPAKIKRVVY